MEHVPARGKNPSGKNFLSGLCDKTLWTLKAIVWPFGKGWGKKLAACTLFWFSVQPATSVVFPTAEAVLKEEGMDPKLAQQLAPGKVIYVRRGDRLPDRLQAGLDDGILSPLYYWRLFGEDKSATMAHAVQGPFTRLSFLTSTPPVDLPVCTIYMQPRKKFARMEAPGITRDTAYKRTLLHEIRHCSETNRKMSDLYKEGDADAHAYTKIAEITNNPALLSASFDVKARRTFDVDHDNILYIDAVLRGQKPPPEREIRQANETAKELKAEFRGRAIPKDAVKPSVLAQRRLELYAKGTRASNVQLTVAGPVTPHHPSPPVS